MVKLFQKVRNELIKGAIVFLAFLYTLGSFQIDTIHKLLHHHRDVSLHSPDQEKNDCHRLVFHNQSTGKCKHPTHLSEFRKCPLCCGLFETHQQVADIISYNSLFFPDYFFIENESTLPCLSIQYLPVRAPPYYS